MNERGCLLVAQRQSGLTMKLLGRRGATDIDKHIGHRLRARRMMLHMTQTDLAKVLRVTFQQLQKYIPTLMRKADANGKKGRPRL
jgi:hypothetical protein